MSRRTRSPAGLPGGFRRGVPGRRSRGSRFRRSAARRGRLAGPPILRARPPAGRRRRRPFQEGAPSTGFGPISKPAGRRWNRPFQEEARHPSGPRGSHGRRRGRAAGGPSPRGRAGMVAGRRCLGPKVHMPAGEAPGGDDGTFTRRAVRHEAHPVLGREPGRLDCAVRQATGVPEAPGGGFTTAPRALAILGSHGTPPPILLVVDHAPVRHPPEDITVPDRFVPGDVPRSSGTPSPPSS